MIKKKKNTDKKVIACNNAINNDDSERGFSFYKRCSFLTIRKFRTDKETTLMRDSTNRTERRDMSLYKKEVNIIN